MMTVTKSIVILCFICLFGVFGTKWSCAETTQENELLITVDLDHQELKSILKSISEQTGFTIKVDNDWVSKKITGIYTKVSVDTFFHRILRGYNVSVLVNEADKSIVVRSFGKEGASMYSVSSSSGERVEPLSGVSLSEIEAIRSQEQADWSNQKNDIEPLTGTPLSEIKTQKLQEEKLYQKYIENPKSVEPLTGMTLGGIEAIRNQEEAKKSSQKNDVEPLTGTPLSEIKTQKLHEEELYQKYIENPESIEPLTGMTLKEIDAIRAREKKE